MEELSKQDKELLKERYIYGVEGLVQFRKINLSVTKDECTSPDYHYAWSDILLFSNRSYVIKGGRECGKSQIVLRSFPLYCLTYPNEDRNYIVIIKASQTLAENKLKEIEEEYFSNPFLSSFCISVITKSAQCLTVKVQDAEGKTKVVRIEAYGKGSNIRGLSYGAMRPKVVVLDDPQDVEDATSDSVSKKDFEWFMGEIRFLGKDTRVFLIGNNLGMTCITEKVYNNAELLEFDRMICPLYQDGESTWKERFTKEFLEKEREAYRNMGQIDMWVRERMCECISEDSRLFRREDFRYYPVSDMMNVAGKGNVYIRVDAAFSKRDSADFTSICVCAIDNEDNWFVLDVIYGRFDLNEKIKHLFNAVRKWRPVNVGVEVDAQQIGFKESLLREMPREQTYFNLVEIRSMGKRKEERIIQLQPRFALGKIFFPQNADWLAEMEMELTLFHMQGTKAEHDDLIDSLSMMLSETHAPISGLTRNQTLPRTAEVKLVW